MRQFAEALGLGGGLESGGIAAWQAFDATAASADDVMVVVSRGDQGVKAATPFEGMALDDTGVVHGAKAAVDRDEV